MTATLETSTLEDYTNGLTLTPIGIAVLQGLGEILPEDTPDVPDTFTPDTCEKADWVLKQIANRRAEAARIRENMELMAREAEREAEFFEFRYGPALQALLRAQIDGGRKKSLRLPNGLIGFRQKPAAVTVTDEAAALAWAKENAPQAVVERLDKKALTDSLRQSGEVVDFAQFTAPEEVFYIK